jgi:hypothetical protein
MKKIISNVGSAHVQTLHTPRYQSITSNTDFHGVKEYIIPDTQRDAINLHTKKAEAHNHCKNTSCTMALNWIGLHFGDQYPVLKSLSTCNEFQYNAILDVFMPSERIQHWGPHIRCFNALFKNAKLPLTAKFGKVLTNWNSISASIYKGHPVVLGTLITKSGHIVLLFGIITGHRDDQYVVIDPYGEPPYYRNTTADYYLITESNWQKWITPECSAIWFEEKI